MWTLLGTGEGAVTFNHIPVGVHVPFDHFKLLGGGHITGLRDE